MKKLFTLVLIFFIGFLGFSQNKKAVISFEKTVIDYGTVNKGDNGVREFVFKNSGNAPLIISNVKSTCGCTIPKKPEKPILPGESEKIQVKYDTKRVGFIRKSISCKFKPFCCKGGFNLARSTSFKLCSYSC